MVNAWIFTIVVLIGRLMSAETDLEIKSTWAFWSSPVACDIRLTVATDNTTGKASAQGTGGSGQFDYRLDGDPWLPHFFSVSVSNGSHTLAVRDRRQPACTTSQAFSIRCPACPQANSGPCTLRVVVTAEAVENTLKAQASGGSGEYEFRLDGGYWMYSFDRIPAAPGLHVIEVRDALNYFCSTSNQIRMAPARLAAGPASRASRLRPVRHVVYETGGYGPNYDPGRKFPAFSMKSPAPVIMGMLWALGTILSDQTDLTRYGFTHLDGVSFRNADRFNPLPSERKAYNCTAFQDDIMFGKTDDNVPQGLIADPNQDHWPNPFAGVADMARLKRRLDKRWDVYVGPNYKGIFSYDYELSWYLGGDGNNVDRLRTKLEGGRYRSRAEGGTDPRYRDMSRDDFRTLYSQTITDYWLQMEEHIKKKMAPEGKLLVYGKGPGVDALLINYNGTPDERGLYGRYKEFSGDDGNGTNQNAQGKRIGHFLDYASRLSVYYGHVIGRHATALVNIWSIYDTQLASIRANGLKPMPISSFMTTSQELEILYEGNTTRQVARAEAPSKQVGEGFAIIPFFRRGGGWLWGSGLEPSDIQAKGAALDHYIHGRYLCSQVSDLIDGKEEYISAEVSFDGGKTWLGDSQNYLRAVNYGNPNRYTAYRVYRQLGDREQHATAIVLAIRNGNRLALAATRVGGTPAGQLSVQVRVKLPSGYFTDTLDLRDREWFIGTNR